jgi:hypothetical protein
MGVIQQLGNTQKGQLASQQFADPRLRYIKELFQLPGSEFLFPDELEDVLVQISLHL